MDTNTNMDMGGKKSSKSAVAIVIVLVVIIAIWLLVSKSNSNNTSAPAEQTSQVPAQPAQAINLGSWTQSAPMPTAVYNTASTLLSNGKVLVVGGHAAGADTGAAQLYNPSTNTWSSAGALSYNVENLQATTLSSGKVLVTGGQTVANHTTVSNNSSLYDPSTNKWSKGPTMNQPRMLQQAVLLSNGKVLVVGGFSGATNGTTCGSGGCKTAELYDPSTNKFTATPNLSYPRNNFTMVYDSSLNKVYVVGGAGVTSCTTAGSVEVYDVAANTWSLGANLNTAPPFNAVSVLLPGGKILIAGGTGCDGQPLSTAEVYNPSTNLWSLTTLPGTIQNNQNYPGNVQGGTLSNGKALIVGQGVSYLYDPATNTWAAGPTSPYSAMRPVLSQVLQSGNIFVAGIAANTAYSETYAQ